jgi:outer membrane murein-binding lipoprotein Lpp
LTLDSKIKHLVSDVKQVVEDVKDIASDVASATSEMPPHVAIIFGIKKKHNV